MEPRDGVSSVVSGGTERSLQPDASEDLLATPAESRCSPPCGGDCGDGTHRGEVPSPHADASGSAEGEKEDAKLPLPALHDYWEDLYHHELQLASSEDGECSEDAEASRCVDRSDQEESDSDASTVYEGNGEEWFEAQSEAIASWLLSKAEEISSEGKLASVRGNSDLPEIAGSETREREASTRDQIPILDVGCGNGLFLLRLLRRGCSTLAGVDYSAAAIRLARQNVDRMLRRLKRRQRWRRTSETCGHTEADQKGGACLGSSLAFTSADTVEPDAADRFPHVCLALVDVRKVVPLDAPTGAFESCKEKPQAESGVRGRLCRSVRRARSACVATAERRRSERVTCEPLKTCPRGVSKDGRVSGDALKCMEETDCVDKGDTASERLQECMPAKRGSWVDADGVGRFFCCCGEGVEDRTECGILPLLHALPQFPIIHDKGTFDVFYLLKIPKVYVHRISALLPARGLLCLTSCNCTRSELEEFFCESERGDEPLFRVVDQLRHKTFKFGGVEGQVVTTLMFARSETC
ncbi:conserved hypothetical protein [Neospora caninum Liverpool]|uniref:Protein-lysine N-methyltransferase BN1204_065110 n=1 Tax=Neospora caninum (strain Liverpool) TaxID=572307 RepID=F0VQT8_NEOCL|nr:conserved hypothetical protein [Neospora caninum Liverpool]CBZ56085.1 conserved hypothetical protein [Neospora caninum Liverpool]CEL70834.1 TPA: Methyltransferase-like protein 10 [Neospora caninum Liverpool]|eukprot:XP_003886111.1 conserved hypothetical protein [Neospora caninum Liverpool]